MPKAQHSPAYRAVPALLREVRESAELTQRQLGTKLRRPQSWVYNCETANRRVDVAEFAAWCKACEVDPVRAFAGLLARTR
jgi:transcriptional regulator with XRE-family HTH domain